MKNKSTRHKELNTFKFLPFSERIASIDVDVFHKVRHEYESQDEEDESFFYQTVEKWNSLNLTQGYQSFKRELKVHNYITLPQVLLSKDVILETLLRHLKNKDPLYLQPLLEIVIATSKDLQKEFYTHYPQFLEILIELLNTKNAEQLEWVFMCLAYLFKFLWRPLVADINSVFNTILPLLSDDKPKYINSFAAESFAFLARKVKDRQSFLNLLLKAVESRQDDIFGCGKLLFQVIKGIDGHFHSCAETLLPFLFQSLRDNNKHDLLFKILEKMVEDIMQNMHPSNIELFWVTILDVLNETINKYESSQDVKLLLTCELLLKLIGYGTEYKKGAFLQQPTAVLDVLLKLLTKDYLSESMALICTQIGILVLLSKRLKISQEQASHLIRKLLAVPFKSVFLFFVDHVSVYSSFEALVLPSFLKYCVKNSFETECFHIMVKLILKKAPLCYSGLKLENWHKYPIDFRENTSIIVDMFTQFIDIENVEDIESFDNYFCSLVCLPHLVNKTTDFTSTVESKLVLLIDKLKNINKDENIVQFQKTLFLVQNTIECLIHTTESSKLIKLFTSIIDDILPFLKDQQCLGSLRILSLCITTLKQYDEVITFQLLLNINSVLERNFSSPYHEIRLLTTHIYSIFENLQEFKITYSSDPDIVLKNWEVFTICYKIESFEPDINTYRKQQRHCEKFCFDKPQITMCNETQFKRIPLRYLCGMLYINFSLIWEPVMTVIASHAKHMETGTFWSVFGEELRSVCNNIQNSSGVRSDLEIETHCSFLSDIFKDYQQFESKPDFVNYRMLLWKAMSLFPNVAEAKTRDVSELLLTFMEKEYFKVNSEGARSCSIKKNLPEEDVENILDVEDNEEQRPAKGNFLNRKNCTKTLICKLGVFSQICSPRSMYREPELYRLYFDFLQHKDPVVQKLALDCIWTYKHKYLTPYKDQLYGLIDKNFKHVLTTFKIDKDSTDVLPEHRENLMLILVQIVFSIMTVKTGIRTGGKSSGQSRRNLVLRFLAGCEQKEMILFLKKALRLYEQYIDDDPTKIVSSVHEAISLDKYLPPKRLQSTINLLNVIFEQFGGLMGHDILTYLLNILFIIGSFLKVSFDNINDVHTGYLSTLRILRTSCINIITNVFKVFDKYPWTNKQINAIFELFVWPSLEKLNIESIHSPTALLKLFLEWGSNPRYFPLLVKHKEGDTSQYILAHLSQLLINDKCHSTVINTVEDILEKLLLLIPEEDNLELTGCVDNLLKVEENILQKVNVIDNLNYGSCILLPFVPTILEKMKKKLQNKSKNLTQKELFILSRISELVWEADISDTVLDLLLPVVLKKCNFSIPEDIVLKYLTTLHNLIRNVEKPMIHLKQISPLFGEISYASCRKKLCEILKTVSEKSDDSFVKITEVILELNAWDPNWIDQPDFERRHTAFKSILNTIEVDKNLDLSMGILIIYNCYFFIRTEKDLALRENSSHIWKRLSVFLCNNFSKHINYILNETLFVLIRNNLKNNAKDDIRNECILLLGCLARECPEKHLVLRDLHIFTKKEDLEVDVFENLVNFQLHRHSGALLKLSQSLKAQESAPNPRTLTQFVLPLMSHYICKEKFIDKNSVIDAAIEAIGTVCRILPWHQYAGVLTYYLDKLTNKVDYQKQLVKLTVAILDAFHFDLSKATHDESKEDGDSKVTENNVSEEENQLNNEKQEVEEGSEGNSDEFDEYIHSKQEDDDVEESTIEGETSKQISVCGKVTVLCKSTSKRVIRTIEVVFLPKLHKSLAELTHHDSSHKINRKITSYEKEEEDLLRVPLSLALVKLLQQLPKHLLDSNIPPVFMKICTFLKSRLESVRKVSRETLQKIMLTLGPSYLDKLLAEMTALLSRGYQVHVLVFTVHHVLRCLKNTYQPNDIDSILSTVLQLCTTDLFGILSEEKEVAKIAVKVSEARHTKTYDTLQILAQYVTDQHLLDLVLPLKQVLETSHSFKTLHKVEESLRYIALGLVDNNFVSVESLLKFAHGVASESIPQLLPKKKKNLTEKEVEKLQREKEDCLIIPKIPNNRTVYRQQNVKTSLETNAHMLVEFGLRLCLAILKRDKLKNDSYSLINPFVIIFKKCLQSRHVQLSTLTLQCLSWVMKNELPSLKENIKVITKDIFSILHKYAASGLSKGDNFDLVLAAFKASAVLVRDVKYHSININQLKSLLLYVEQDIHDHDRQATAFNLLKAIIARKIVAPEIHDIIQKVAELSITSELDHVRSQARAVVYQFIMDYPLGNTREKLVAFYQAQLTYSLKHGRESAIEMLQMLINSFPINLLDDHSGTLLIHLGCRLINDQEPECKKMAIRCISSMLKRFPKKERDPLFEMVLIWFNKKCLLLRELAALLCGIFVEVEKSAFEERFKKLKSVILKQFGLNFSPGKFVKLHKDSEEDDPTELEKKDHHLFQTVHLLLDLCAHCPSFLKQDYIESLSVHVQTLLFYAHDWVRLVAARFLGYVLSTIDPDHLADLILSNKRDESGYLVSDPVNALKSLTLDLCDQLYPDGIRSDLAKQVIKNLLFVARVLQHIPIKTNDNLSQLNLLWLTKRMRKIINTEIVENYSSAVLRTQIFVWIGGVVTALDVEKFTPVLHHLLAPVVRELVTEDVKHAPLHQLAKELSNLIKQKIGMEEYTKTLSKLQQNLSVKRAERKRHRTQLAVIDPELHAKKKIKKHEKKKELRKRKIDQRKGSNRNFKKRKVDLEVSDM